MTLRSILALLAGFAAASPSPAQIGAYDLLEKVREAYRQTAAYHDRGEIEILGAEGELRRLRFETVVDGGVFQLLVRSVGSRRILQSQNDEVVLHDLALGQYRRLGSVPLGLIEIVGQGGFEALAVPAALAGSLDGLADPEGAAVEGTTPCDGSTCHVLLLSRARGTSEWELWIDRDSFLIRRLEVVLRPADEGLTAALAEAGLESPAGGLGASSATTTVRVRHEIGEGPPPRPMVLGEARLVEQWEISVAESELEAPPHVKSAPAFDEEITVKILQMAVRVVDSRGNPVLGLEPADFRVLFKGEEIPTIAADWVSSDPAHRDERLHAELAKRGIVLPPVEKLVVFFVQTGLDPSRIKGHLRTLPHAQNLVATLQPNDRAAVVSFDSRLKMWQDFTRRHDEVVAAIEQAIYFGGQPRLRGRSPQGPSLELDFREARDAASPEKALELVGRALQPLSGEKVMVYLGWGMGRFGRDGVTMTPDYAPAVQALNAARTSVFVLDVTDAGYHSLELGLKNVAAQTGGTYEKTSVFAEQAASRLAETISGHYLLIVDRAELPDDGGSLRIKLRGKKGRIVSDRFLIARVE